MWCRNQPLCSSSTASAAKATLVLPLLVFVGLCTWRFDLMPAPHATTTAEFASDPEQPLLSLNGASRRPATSEAALPRQLQQHYHRHHGKSSRNATREPPQPAQSTAATSWEPTCQITVGKQAKCERCTVSVPCPEGGRWGARPGGTGAWAVTEKYIYYRDRGLVEALARHFRDSSVLELGAGKGCYTSALRRAGIPVRAYDGAPGIAELTGGLVHTADLTSDLTLQLGKKSADWVLCLEVGEHIPQKHEDVLLHNVLDTARKGVIISWSNNDGNGHVNRRPNEYVIEEMERRGFEHVPALSKKLRAAVSNIDWFRRTIMVFRRRSADS